MIMLAVRGGGVMGHSEVGRNPSHREEGLVLGVQIPATILSGKRKEEH